MKTSQVVIFALLGLIAQVSAQANAPKCVATADCAAPLCCGTATPQDARYGKTHKICFSPSKSLYLDSMNSNMISGATQLTRMQILERTNTKIDSGKISKNLLQRTLMDTESTTHMSHQFTNQTLSSELLINTPSPIILDLVPYSPHLMLGGTTLEQVTSGTDFGIIMLRPQEVNFTQQVLESTMISIQCKV